jgi:Bacterial Ig domain
MAWWLMMILMYTALSVQLAPGQPGPTGLPEVSPRCYLSWTPPAGVALAQVQIFVAQTSQGYDYRNPAAEIAAGTPIVTCAAIGATQGPYVTVLRAVDTEGRVSPDSEELAFTVVEGDGTPMVLITAPSHGAQVTHKRKVMISAEAEATHGIREVNIAVNRTLVCRDTTAPYGCLWSVPAGNKRAHHIQASITDMRGVIAESPIVTVTSTNMTLTDAEMAQRSTPGPPTPPQVALGDGG